MSTVLQGELRAIHMALQYVQGRANVLKVCAILTDCKAALEKIRGLKKPTYTVVSIREKIQDTQSQGISIKWYWVKAHRDDNGNKRAEEQAKEAANDRERRTGFNKIPLSVIKDKTKAELKLKWQARWRGAIAGRMTANFLPSVNVSEKIRQTITYQVTQLITDHGNMGAYLFHRKLAAQPMCECEGGLENSEHILFHGPLETEARNEARTKMQQSNLEWPCNFTEVRQLADKVKWWEALATFAARIDRLTTDSNSDTDREGPRSEYTEAKQREERRMAGQNGCGWIHQRRHPNTKEPATSRTTRQARR